MQKVIAVVLVIMVALTLPNVLIAQTTTTTSIASDGNTSGVITVIHVDSDTNLVGFVLSTQDGELIEVPVNDSSKFGLENAVGDRWVADFKADPSEALLRITDQRERFAPVTVTVNSGITTAVVDREQGDLEQNLGFLFAIYIVTWAGFFAYVFIVSRRQGHLAQEINALKRQVSTSI